MKRTAYLSLADLKPGESGRILSLKEEDSQAFKQLVAMGILPKTKIHLIRNTPAFVLSLGNARFALDKGLAKLIEVIRI